MKPFTIAEAAEATGLTQKSLRRRIERGTLRSVLSSDGRRRIPASELERAGVLSEGPGASGGTEGQGHPGAPPAGQIELGQLLERLEALAAENGRLRMLEAQTGSLERQLASERESRERAEEALFETRTRLMALEAKRARRRWPFGRTAEVPPVGPQRLLEGP